MNLIILKYAEQQKQSRSFEFLYKLLKMRIILIFLIFTFSISIQVTSWTGQEKRVDFADHQSHPYQIAIRRTNSSTPDQQYHCQAFGRRIGTNRSLQLFRLDTHLSESSKERQQSVLKNLLQLELQQQIIDFEVSGEDYYVVSTENVLYFIQHQKGDKYSKAVKTSLPPEIKDSISKGDFFLLVIENGIAMILANNPIVCHGTQCGLIKGWQPIVTLTHATYTKAKNGRQYIMISELSGFSIMEYNGIGQVSNYHRFNQQFFNRSAVAIYDINPQGIKDSQIYVLDYEEGVYMVKYDNEDPTKITRVEHILPIQKCFSMDNVGYKYFILICRSTIDESDYIAEVHYNQKQNKFTSLIPNNQQFQKIVDVQLTPNYYISWARSGFKFYWMSTNTHYPQQYRRAGQLFFYNTIRARYKNINSKNYLYYATPTSVQRIQISQLAPYVSCMSSITTQQEYSIEYAVPCDDNKQKVCTKSQTIEYNSTKHLQISILFGVLPLILSFLGLILVVILIVIIACEYRKKEQDLLEKTQSLEIQVNDLGDMMASNR